MYNQKEQVLSTPSKWLRKPKQEEQEIKNNHYEEALNIYYLIATNIDLHSNQMLQLLTEFKTEQGHCVVPAEYPNKNLINWSQWLRKAKAQGILLPNKIKKLTALGFVWSEDENLYQQNLIKLKQFIAKHGNALVPATYKEDPAFGIWVKTMRKNKRSQRLSHTSIKELELLGFIWDENINEAKTEKPC
jgi:hypothetical protein